MTRKRNSIKVENATRLKSKCACIAARTEETGKRFAYFVTAKSMYDLITARDRAPAVGGGPGGRGLHLGAQ